MKTSEYIMFWKKWEEEKERSQLVYKIIENPQHVRCEYRLHVLEFHKHSQGLNIAHELRLAVLCDNQWNIQAFRIPHIAMHIR